MMFQCGDADKVITAKNGDWKMTQRARFEIVRPFCFCLRALGLWPCLISLTVCASHCAQTTGETIEALRAAGLQVAVYKSVQGDETYCLSERRCTLRCCGFAVSLPACESLCNNALPDRRCRG